MGLPYKISTLLYCFNDRDEVLLLERAQEPNLGQWSPCGGKLHTQTGESPYACACREAREEAGLDLAPEDLHLTGIVSEHGYLGQAHWLMFLFEVRPKLDALPLPIKEGRFAFFPHSALAKLPIPQTDRERIWPLFWQHRGGFFAAHCRTQPNGGNRWEIEESSSSAPQAPMPPAPAHGQCARENAQGQPASPACPEVPVIDLHSDHYFMGEALRQARKALKADEVPVGAVIVREGTIIATACNQVELLHDATAHAEMLALTQAEAAVGDWRLTECTLYATKEPCPMCAGAVVHTRLSRVVFGAFDSKAGAAGSAMNLLQFPTLNHRCAVTSGVREAECRALLRDFFGAKRKTG